ncbi:hypothetical protein chiPu_0027003 [Chiloscyllium punctatum]|uniref:Uncharacterized protein n=1 Tax=Chiloscyllium punctatum TaxID=137246 RepID=A0A401TKR4_CHIPU|nr:hypothetical protein [Chiloscyllium punctatum]
MARPDSAAGRGWGALRTLHTGRQTHREHGKPTRHTWFHAPPEGGGRARQWSLPSTPGVRRRILPGGYNTRYKERRATFQSNRPSQPTRSQLWRTTSGGNAPSDSRAHAGSGPC